jgi:LasA protease
LKPGKVAARKTRSAAKAWGFSRGSTSGQKLAVSIVLLALWLVPIACTGGFYYPAELTATALSDYQVVMAEALTLETPELEAAQPEQTPEPQQPNDPVIEPTAEPVEEILPSPTPTPTPILDTATPSPPILYYTQAGDTLKALAIRFAVDIEEITSPDRIPPEGLFDPGILLLIPQRLSETSSSQQIIPDSEIVYSPSALDIDLPSYIREAGGYLSRYGEWRSTGYQDGAKLIQRVALENSINPRLLLAILEKQSHWVYGQPRNMAETEFPIAWMPGENEKKGMYYQLTWVVQQLNIGYYGWRDGTVTHLVFPDGEILRLAPDLNAGTVSLLYFYARLYNQDQWSDVLYGNDGVMALYESMFGSPWLRAQTIEPLFPATLTQPPLELPWLPGRTWAYTGGPHSAWGPGGARAALDFAPSTETRGCYTAVEYVTAVASGLVVRSENGVVLVDLDGDGYEQTGWSILYLHIAAHERVPVGTWVNLNDRIGFPSCEGGISTGTHVHIARKYNGEWILADGPMPFVLSGWRAHAAPELYKGWLTKDGKTITSSLVGNFESRVTR